MPVFTLMIQGNTTVITNFIDVTTKLRRDPAHLLKYLTKEFAVPTNIDGKRAILNSKFREEQINKRLKNYIDEYVLCNECGKPDTSMIIFEGAKYKRCEVCGARAPVRTL
jgi:translation initiation factor 2 subunit 2